jgi:hypothetical protein
MAFEFNCVHCGYYLKTDDQEIAEATQCPVCGNSVEPPAAGNNEPPGIAAGNDHPRGENELEPSSHSLSPSRLETGDVCSTAWSIFKNQLGLAIGGVWVHTAILGCVSVPTSIANNILQQPDVPDEWIGLLGVAVVGGNILSLLLGAFMNGGLCLFLLKLVRGEGAEITDIFRGGRYFGRMLLCTICFAVMVGFGTVACVIPGIILSLMFLPYQFVLVDRDPSDLLGALSQSKQVTDGHKLQLLVISFAIMIISIIGLLACLVGTIFTLPLVNLIWVVAYMRMTGQRTIVDVG